MADATSIFVIIICHHGDRSTNAYRTRPRTTKSVALHCRSISLRVCIIPFVVRSYRPHPSASPAASTFGWCSANRTAWPLTQIKRLAVRGTEQIIVSWARTREQRRLTFVGPPNTRHNEKLVPHSSDIPTTLMMNIKLRWTVAVSLRGMQSASATCLAVIYCRSSADKNICDSLVMGQLSAVL